MRSVGFRGGTAAGDFRDREGPDNGNSSVLTRVNGSLRIGGMIPKRS